MRFDEMEFESVGGPHGSAGEGPWHEYEGEGAPFPPAHEVGMFRENEWEGEVPLGGTALARAVTANRRNARLIGWGCVVGNQVRPILELRNFLGLVTGATEEDLARGIARWQQGARLTPDGQLNDATWRRMMSASPPVLPPTRFRPASWPVVLGGRTLGVLEKIMPYRRCFFNARSNVCRSASNGTPNERGGSNIQLGFRVTDIDAVRAAGFVDGSGEDQFRWVQVVEFVTVPNATGPGFVRRNTRIIDPTTLVGAIPDAHPYYWDEVTPTGSDPAFLNQNFVNRQSTDPASNRLCYDLIFEDLPGFPLSAAQPGRRAWFNFELALVGVRFGAQTRNVVLNTVLWGFDLVAQPSGGVDVRMSALRAGVTGGSAHFRQTISRDINRGLFPNHCFTGGQMTGTARCP